MFMSSVEGMGSLGGFFRQHSKALASFRLAVVTPSAGAHLLSGFSVSVNDVAARGVRVLKEAALLVVSCEPKDYSSEQLSKTLQDATSSNVPYVFTLEDAMHSISAH